PRDQLGRIVRGSVWSNRAFGTPQPHSIDSHPLKPTAIESRPTVPMPNGSPDRPPALALRDDGDRATLSGALVIHTLAQARELLRRRPAHRKLRTLDLGDVERLDTPGALLLCELRASGVELTGARSEHA